MADDKTNSNSGNGWKTSVSEFRGFVRERVQTIERDLKEDRKSIKAIEEDISEIKIAVAIHPQNCVQIQPIIEIKKDVQHFKDEENKVKAKLGVIAIVAGSVGSALFLFGQFLLNKFF